jgi:hypothetical protein
VIRPSPAFAKDRPAFVCFIIARDGIIASDSEAQM